MERLAAASACDGCDTEYVMRIWMMALGLLLSLGTAGRAEQSLIVLDASGSMWGRIDGKPKLEIAREALKAVLGGMSPQREIGLLAYGHREKGNCSDIELIVPPGRNNAAAITDAAARLRFLGKTPLTEAVRQAAVALRYTEEKATVILITDGIETCQADPCALGAELAKAGVGFTAHVVGFDLSREDGRKVACLAEKTGGRYIAAGNAAQLQDALMTTVSATLRPAAVQSVKRPAATVRTGAKPSIGQSFTAEWTGPGGTGDYLDIVPAGSKGFDAELSYVYVEAGKAAALRAPDRPGPYDLRYVWAGPEGRQVLATARIAVADAPHALEAPASVAAGTTFDVSWKGPGQPGDYVDLVRSDHTAPDGEIAYAYLEAGNPVRLKAPGEAGSYQLRYILAAPDGRKALVAIPLEVTPSTATLAFPPDAIAGATISVHWRGPGAAGDYVDLVREGHRDTSGELAYAYVEQSEDQETVALRAPGAPGDYRIRYVLAAAGGHKILAEVPLTVRAATASLEAPARVQRGVEFEVSWQGPNGEGDYVDIVVAGSRETAGELTYISVEAESRGRLAAPDKPGRYDIRYILKAGDGLSVLARRSIEVR